MNPLSKIPPDERYPLGQLSGTGSGAVIQLMTAANALQEHGELRGRYAVARRVVLPLPPERASP